MELHWRLSLVKKAIILFEQGNAPGDHNLLVEFIEAQIRLIKEGK